MNNTLRTLFWEATMRCNAHCAFCGSRCTAEKSNELTTAEICRALDEAAQAWNPADIMLNVTGGEPLLRRDLFEVTAHAHALGFDWGIVTNGTLIDEETVEQMRQTGMKTISVSLDGMREYHERIRRLPGGFERIIRGIRLLKQADFLHEIMVTTVVNHENLAQLEPLSELLHELQVDTWRVAMVDPIGRAQDNASLLLTKDDLRAYFDFLDAHKFDHQPMLTTSCSHYLGEKDTVYREHRFCCQSGKSVMSILANGDIAGCPNVPRVKQTIEGNVLYDSLREVWENRFTFSRTDARRVGKCADCPQWEHCRGDSLHTWNFEKERPNFCLMESGLPFAAPTSPSLPDDIRKKLKAHIPSLCGIRFSYGSSESRKVWFTPSAAEELRVFFQWGKRHPRSRCELMAGLVGHEIEGGVLVEFLADAPLKARSEIEAAFDEETYRTALRETEIINSNLPHCEAQFRLLDTPCTLVGFAHTHPNELSAGMSIPDMQLFDLLRRSTDARLFIILNPHTGDLYAYRDSAYIPIDAELLMPEEEAHKWTFQMQNKNTE